jgi:DNA polymerase/3'-5' exonuclease PolX
VSEKRRIPLDEARTLAGEALLLIAGVCERIEILGSIRRRKETIGDIELLCVPRFAPGDPVGLFGETGDPVNLELLKVNELRGNGVFVARLDVNGRPACGERYHRLEFKGFALDIFVCLSPAEYGVLKLIRTGSSEFNQRFVLQKSAGGKILQAGQKIENGALWEWGRKVPTPEEIDVFNATGMAYLEPWVRNA